MPDKYEQVRRNLASHSDWPQSFRGRLAEYGEWDVREFWALHASLIEIAAEANADPKVERWLALALLTIQQRVLQSFAAYCDAKDFFKIKGVSETELYEFLEYFELAITGAISGVVHPQISIDRLGPLPREEQ